MTLRNIGAAKEIYKGPHTHSRFDILGWGIVLLAIAPVNTHTLYESSDNGIGVTLWEADPTNLTRSSRRRGSFSTFRRAAARPLKPRPIDPLQ